MGKANKRIAVRRKSSTRDRTTTKPTRKNRTKRTAAKKSKSKLRMGTKAIAAARAKLEAMPLADRIAAVADDVKSKRDEYRSINSHDLASLLDTPDTDLPSDPWVFVRFVPRFSVRDILTWNDEECIPELLETHLTPERCKEIRTKIKLLKRNKTKLRRSSLDFLTEEEKQTIERLYMESEAKSNGAMWVIVQYAIKAPHGKELAFEGTIEDDGHCVHLLTPYDERDGKFVDLSDCLTVP